MAEPLASNSATMPEDTRSLADEQGTGVDELDSSQNNGQAQDVPMISQDDPEKISKSSDPQPDTAAQGSSAPVPNYDGAGAGSVGSPARTATPHASGRFKEEQQQQGATSSRAQSAVPAERATIPTEAVENGAPTRVYLNQNVTQHLLDGMKMLALHKPIDPLRVLGEFLLQRSAEVEAAATADKNTVPAARSEEDQDMNGAE